MRDLIGLKIKILVDMHEAGGILTYTGKITDCSETHVTFLDKFDIINKFRIKDIVSVTVLEGKNG